MILLKIAVAIPIIILVLMFVHSRVVIKGRHFKKNVIKPAIPKIKNIHERVYLAVSQENALDMASWHTCDTTHCRAGWVVTLAGEDGRVLESHFGTCLAAQLIYRDSSPLAVSLMRFFDNDVEAMADIKKMAELEKEIA